MKGVIIAVVLILLLGLGSVFAFKQFLKPTGPVPTPTEEPIVQLTPDQYPKVSLNFSTNGHFVTVNVNNLHAAVLEYDLIYEATVKKSRLQTGVSASSKIDNLTNYSKEQLLGSESSGKFTYHENIKNAQIVLTLRDKGNRSIYKATYPFTHTPGKTVELQATE
jgi:hypothetical protein